MADVSNEAPSPASASARSCGRARCSSTPRWTCACKQGYELTTVEQIAAAADVSPRTFSRYFPTKDAVFLTLIDDYAHEVAIELETVDAASVRSRRCAGRTWRC